MKNTTVYGMSAHLAGALLLAGWLVACAQAPALTAQEDATTRSLRARGNEPFWSLSLQGEQLQWQTPEEKRQGWARPQISASGTRWLGQLGEQHIEVWSKGHVCRDSMSGLPYPYEVLVFYQARRYQGCGGEPASLLQGVWQVTELAGGLPQGAQLTLQFGPEGQLSGRAACNRYTSRYTLSGEGLQIAPGASTRMACPPALMEVENRYLRQLEAVQGFDIDKERGTLWLLGPQGQRIVARRP